MKVLLRCQSFIADLPACAAFLNVKQFNGYFGCINCFHPGTYSAEYRKMIYKPLKNVQVGLKTTIIIASITGTKGFFF